MSSARRAAASRLALIIVAIFVLFAGFQEPARHLEAVLTARLTELVSGADAYVIDAVIVVRPAGRPLFVALLTPSCSVLASAVSLCLLGSTATTSPKRRFLAVATAVLAVIVGNFVRLTGSLVAGSLGGTGALVAFHDTVGSLLTFAYILGGYVLMLWIVLPAERREPQTATATATTGVHVDVPA